MAKLDRMLRRDSVGRYRTKLYLWRSVGGLIPEEMALDTVNSITDQWQYWNSKFSAIRQQTKSILQSKAVPTVNYLAYFAYAEQLGHAFYKCMNSAEDTTECMNNMTDALKIKYTTVYDLDMNILDMIVPVVKGIMSGGE